MGLNGPIFRGLPLPRCREAAATHFRKLGEKSLASGDALPGSTASRPYAEMPCTFEIYRADEVRVTATRFSGGDWHWRLSGAAGEMLLDTGGYRTESDCRKAVLLLKNEAALATVPSDA